MSDIWTDRQVDISWQTHSERGTYPEIQTSLHVLTDRHLESGTVLILRDKIQRECELSWQTDRFTYPDRQAHRESGTYPYRQTGSHILTDMHTQRVGLILTDRQVHISWQTDTQREWGYPDRRTGSHILTDRNVHISWQTSIQREWDLSWQTDIKVNRFR